ncbi:cytochrome-c peroxidase [Niabella ginsenosidivorans]|uniref:Cytochrome-c peroxidase n=1 Tax=Niabella ginsenosidivorans TaxID=1176587 RepID=A0A1A9I457_9BACT|nr:cytochrome c peroxidase [Niabella ginsenosidivorans]ANH81354.1 cytochrome-c peroxidase [Niabella ginsenosidivorans]
MRKTSIVIAIIVVLGMMSFSYTNHSAQVSKHYADSLRNLYSRPVSQWPEPAIDPGVTWYEMGVIPKDTTWMLVENDPVTRLGMFLFFDPRLSGSSQISCSSCHDPDLAWQDGRVVALGNDHLQGSRNTQSLLNVYIYPKLFWDGRANDFESQMVAPLSAHHEMNMDVPLLPEKLAGIKGYDSLFIKAFGSEKRSFDKISKALAAFQKTIRSRGTRFDKFMSGDYKAFNDDEIAGLHLFRTKARCMNCHNGVFLTDTSFHNIGLTYYKRKYEDLGRYNVTHNKDDVGKFRTPSLRELERTRPWMHNGLFDNLEGVINMYNSGMPQKAKTEEQKNDPLFPRTDHLLKPLGLTKEERQQLIAFLHTLTGVPYRMRRPELPK